MKFRAYKRDDEGGYLIEGLVFSDDEEDSSAGFILERINCPSGKSIEFTLGTEANSLGMQLFDMLNDIFKKYGKFNEVKKVSSWISRRVGFSFYASLLGRWDVEESKWKDLTKEIEEKIKVS
jgi:hypothetical protein